MGGILRGLSLSALIALFFCAPAMSAPAAAPSASPTPSKERIMVFGDSLSAAHNIDPKSGWVNLMAEKLAPSGVSVVNASISGETSAGGLARIKADLTSNKPSIVLIELGANDALRGLPVADMKTNLQAIVAACRAAGARVILIGVQIPPNYGLDYAANFRELYPELAGKLKTGLVPFLLEGIADKMENFQADRLHPIAAAQPRILDNVLPVVRKMLAAGHGR